MDLFPWDFSKSHYQHALNMDPGNRWTNFHVKMEIFRGNHQPELVWLSNGWFDFLEENSCWLEGSQRARKARKVILELTSSFHRGKPGRFSHLGKATEVLSICFLVRYAGGDHTQTIEKFYRDVGFSSHALPRNGRVGKDLGDQGDCIPKIHRVVSRKSYYVYWQWLNLKFLYFQERKMITSIISITSRSRKDQRIMWSPKDNFGPREPRGWAQSQFCVAVPPISQIHFKKTGFQPTVPKLLGFVRTRF